MNLVVFFTCISVFCLVLVLCKNMLQKHQNQKKRLKDLNTVRSDIYDEKLNIPFTQRFIKPIITKTLNIFKGFKRKSNSSAATKKLERDLKLAGILMSADEFEAIKTISVGSFVGGTVIMSTFLSLDFQTKFLVVLISIILAVLVPRYLIKSKIKNRKANIKSQLPDAMDLLSASVEAGLSFDGAISRLIEQTHNELSVEFAIMQKEIQMGRSRRDALKDLGMRNDISELGVFASSMIQAEQYGISIKNVLKSQSKQLRTERKNKAEEKALKAPVKMMIPIILFIFPVIFIILLAPAAFDILESFGG